jgi:two-component system sensor histidine kinase UhpB
LLEVQEDESRRLARELHDQVGQVLTALKVNLQVIERQPAAAPVALKIEECAQLADAALQQVRTLMLDLRPPQLDELGLAVALRSHAERVVTPANLALHFSAPDALPEMPLAIEIVCFRITQEALTNILRHAGARNVWIELAVAGDKLKLTVRDDGKGFDLAEAHRRAMGGGSIGLLSMEERAALADGRIEISTAPGAGTTVRAMFSLQAAQATSSS